MDIKKLSSLYTTAVYIRLSKEDNNIDYRNKIESNSVSNQKTLILNELEKMPNVSLYNIYIDDGFTGLDFDRPAFKNLLSDIHDNKVNMVIVKDLSRLGRDYIEVGAYIKRIFPALGVRFVSILDHFDSLTASSSDINLLIPIKNFVNDNYSRDISIKIRSNQAAMRNNGLYIGAHVAYGYKKSEESKNVIVLDDYAANIVRKIFYWKLNGLSCDVIANKLNDLGVLPPSEYKRKSGINYKSGFQNSIKAKWFGATVTRILSNKIYIGILEQGKTKKLNYKLKEIVKKPVEQWCVVKDSHPPIVSESDFYAVENLLKADMRISPKNGTSYIFSGLLFCGECNAGMVHRVIRYKGKEKVYYICSTYNKGKKCSRHSIEEEKLKNLLLETINQHITSLVEVYKLFKKINKQQINSKDIIFNNEELKKKNSELYSYKQKEITLHKDFLDGLISKQEYKDFLSIYQNRYEALEQSIINIETEISKIFEDNNNLYKWIESFKKYKSITELNRLAVVTLVNKIIVYENKKVEIIFNYQDEYNLLCKIVGTVEPTFLQNKEVVF